MKLPDRLPMRTVTFMDGADGYALQEYRNDRYGITCIKDRKHSKAPWVTFWRTSHIPGAVFFSYAALKQQMEKTIAKDGA